MYSNRSFKLAIVNWTVSVSTDINSSEVKRATIVGNPMYSRGGAEPAPELGLDDLHMDYDQIMHYFHNLKV